MKADLCLRPTGKAWLARPARWLFALAMLASSPAWSAVRHVAPAHPHAGDYGEGEAARPYRTIAYAMSRLQPGDTLRIAAGNYRETLVFPKRNWSAAMPTAIVADGKVTILGTDAVGGWEPAGPELFVRRGWQEEPQQVVLNGRLLRQVGGTIFDGYPERPGHELAGLHADQGGIWPTRLSGGHAAMPPDSFFYDARRRELLVRTAANFLPDGAVEVATRAYLVQGEQVEGITIRGLRFRYANTSTRSRQGAVTLMGNGNTLEDLVVEDADGAGIEVAGDRNRILRCTVTRSGYLGIKARGRQQLISGNRVTHNNMRGFNKWWEAGGMKFIGDHGLKQSLVENNEVAYNQGDGIWFDWGNDDNRVERNTVAYNQGFGIHYEASSRGRISDNQVFGNRQRGIYLPHSHDSTVTRNLVAANGLEGITVIDEQRRDGDGKLDLRPLNNVISANLVAWNKGPALILPGRRYANASDRNVYVEEDGSPQFAMGWPRLWTDKKNLAQWRSQEGQDGRSSVVKATMDPAIRNALARGEIRIDWSALAPYRAMIAARESLPDAATLSGEKPSDKTGPR